KTRDDLKAQRDQLDALTRVPRLDSKKRLHDALQTRLADWRGLLRDELVKARQLLRKLVNGRIKFTPEPEQKRYRFEGRAVYGRLLEGVVGQNSWCPRGDSNTRHAV